jgi:hypothetical protein
MIFIPYSLTDLILSLIIKINHNLFIVIILFFKIFVHFKISICNISAVVMAIFLNSLIVFFNYFLTFMFMISIIVIIRTIKMMNIIKLFTDFFVFIVMANSTVVISVFMQALLAILAFTIPVLLMA